MPPLIVLVAAASPVPASAHEGHGLYGAHWHSTDAWGFAVVGAIALAAWWWRGRKP